MVWEDPIVAETRALRQQLMDEVGNDLDKLIEFLKQRELEHPERLVTLPPRRAIAVGTREESESAG